jgi:phosphate uptake regulator
MVEKEEGDNFDLDNIPSIQTRKLSQSGNSSLIMAIPLNWARRNKLGAGSRVLVKCNENIEIMLNTKENRIKMNEYISKIKKFVSKKSKYD